MADPVSTRTGIVFIQDFDRGVIESLGAVQDSKSQRYVINNIDGVSTPPSNADISYEGIPVFFAWPDDVIDEKIVPAFVIRRDDMSPAMARWHLGSQQYWIPAPDSTPIAVKNRITGDVVATGYSDYEYQDQAVPFDLTYTIQIRARYRNNLRVEGLKMLRYLMRTYQPYTRIFVKDSLNATRTYDAFVENPSVFDDVTDIATRMTGFNILMRVEAELDLNDPVVTKVLAGYPQINMQLLKRP